MSPDADRPSKEMVLILDDNHDVVDSLAILLEDAGHDVVSAYSAREALDLLDTVEGIAVVVSDVRMPELDGLDFLRVVRHRFPAMRVVLMTGDDITDDDIVPRGAMILSKPVEFDDLAKLLSHTPA